MWGKECKNTPLLLGRCLFSSITHRTAGVGRDPARRNLFWRWFLPCNFFKKERDEREETKVWFVCTKYGPTAQQTRCAPASPTVRPECWPHLPYGWIGPAQHAETYFWQVVSVCNYKFQEEKSKIPKQKTSWKCCPGFVSLKKKKTLCPKVVAA